MIIEGKFYKLTPVSDISNFYDLELLYNIGGKNPRQEYKIAAYGITLPHAIKCIIRYTINNKFNTDTITLKQYLDEFKKIKTTIEKEIDY